jgi:hypothetical protein
MPEPAPGFAGDDVERAAQMVVREFFIPACGVRLDTEIARVADPLLWDTRPAAAPDQVGRTSIRRPCPDPVVRILTRTSRPS